MCMWPVGAAAASSQQRGSSRPDGSPPVAVHSGSSNGTTSAQSPSLQTAAPSHAPTPVNSPASTGSNGSEQQSAAPQTRTNGNGATASAVSTSATDTVEHWVNDNLSSFLADPNPRPDLPTPPEATGSQAQRAALERQGAPADTRRAGPNGFSAIPATNSKRPSSQQQQPHEVQQLQQQQQRQSDQQLWQQQQQEQTGANGMSKGARQSWGSVKQKGPRGAWQGRGQGPAGGTGGSWATVDPNMENARRLLSPWRSALHFCCMLYILLSLYQ